MSSLHIAIAASHAFVVAATNTTTKKTTSTSAISFLPILILIGIGAYLLFIRPRNQAMRRQQQQSQELAVGDRVLTRAGIVGRVRGFNGDRVQLEVATGVVIEVVRQGVGQKLPDELDDEDLIPPPPGGEEDLEDEEHDGDEHDDGSGDEEAEEEGAAASTGEWGHDIATDWGEGHAEDDWNEAPHDAPLGEAEPEADAAGDEGAEVTATDATDDDTGDAEQPPPAAETTGRRSRRARR